MPTPDAIRRELVELIDARGAHLPFDAAVEAFPANAINAHAPSVSYTPWHLVEHIRFAQTDILDYIRDRTYLAPTWPDEYWPAPDATATADQFRESVERFKSDRAALRELVSDPTRDLLETIAGTPGHSILREIRTVGAHNAYHIGEFAILRQVMGTWPADRRG